VKIRNRITIWVSLAGLLSTVVLSVIVFFWGLETPYEFLDQELEIRTRYITAELIKEQQEKKGVGEMDLEHLSYLYWTRVYDENKKLLFASKMARAIDLPIKNAGQGYLIRTDIPLSQFYAEEGNEASAFWNRVFEVTIQDRPYLVHVARPVESIIGESIESAVMIGSALLISSLVLIVVSYLVAGKILRPIQEINALTTKINENTLQQRIPLSHNGDEIDELATSLNAMFNRLQSSFFRQKEFVANASHELKTPITLLRLSMEETLQDENLPPALQEKLLAQDRALARMNQLVKSLLDLSRLELTDHLEKETFCLNEMIRSVVENFQLLLLEQQLTFTARLDGKLAIHADKEKIRRMLINLLDNAIRYNTPGGSITCQTTAAKSSVTLLLSNTGPGVGQEDQTRIFDQFYRCEKSRSKVHGGSGLGLTIVKRIVELHAGTITAESSPGPLTTLKVVLPAAPPCQQSIG
jgi:signal transduction histidine kinase